MSASASELETTHELDLAWQAGSGVGRCIVVVVFIKVDGRGNDSEVRFRCHVGWRLPRRVVNCEYARIAKLNVIENVEGLHAELHRHTLGQLGFLEQSQVNLPTAQSAEKPVGRIAIASEEAVGVNRGCLQCCRVNER